MGLTLCLLVCCVQQPKVVAVFTTREALQLSKIAGESLVLVFTALPSPPLPPYLTSPLLAPSRPAHTHVSQVGMSGGCYPDSLIGTIPNLYYYAANNPSEATIAKRRSYANTISYLTPPAENAGLYKGLKELKELISSYQSMRDSGRAEQITATIIETARQCNLDKDVNLPADDAAMAALSLDERDTVVGNVYRKLMEIESRLLPCGLHVVGVMPTAEEAVATLVNIGEIDRPDQVGEKAGMAGSNVQSVRRMPLCLLSVGRWVRGACVTDTPLISPNDPTHTLPCPCPPPPRPPPHPSRRPAEA